VIEDTRDPTHDFADEADRVERIRDAAEDMLKALKGFALKPDRIVAGEADCLILRVPIAVIQRAAAAVAKAEGR
jgi:hypothetical protein